MQKNATNENENDEILNGNILEYYALKLKIEELEKKQKELKEFIISMMESLDISKKNVIYNEDSILHNISCTLVSPVEVNYNLEAVRQDFPKFIDKQVKLALETPEAIANFKIKLKEMGINKEQFRELINTMTVVKIEKVNETEIKKEYDKGNIEDISKYASVKEKTKYIKLTVNKKGQ